MSDNNINALADGPSLSSSASNSSSVSAANTNNDDVNAGAMKSEEQNNNFVQAALSEEYLEKGEIASELQENSSHDTKSIYLQDNQSKKLFELSKSNNIIYIL